MSTIFDTPLENRGAPKYRLVSDRIRQAIANDSLKPGAKLPPVRELSYQLGITPGTVARAYSLLVDEGVLVAEIGRGTFVADPADFAEDSPIEVDAIAHNSSGDGYEINMFSPHLASVGQAALIRELLSEVAQDPPSGLMHYPNRVSARPAREAVIRWLSDRPLGRIQESDVVLANGGQNAISLIFQSILTGRRPTVLVEELAYPGFRRAAELLRADVVPVAMDDQGVIPEALEAAARQHEAQIFCTLPDVHNPTGLFTPHSRREDLVNIARQRDLQILEDDCYFSDTARAPGYRMLAPERSWYVSSLSKSLTPALRIGVGIAPPGQGARLRRAAEHGFFGLATPITDLLAKLLTHPKSSDLARDVRRKTDVYVQCAVNTLGMYRLRWRAGVPFVWLELPEGWRAGAFCQAAEAQGVQIRSAEEYASRNARTTHAVRMAVNAGVSLASYEAALQRLRNLLDNPPERIGV